MASIWAELKRRKVIRVAITYGIASWLTLQLAGVLTNLLSLPDWAGRFVLLLLVIGFPLAIAVAWAFDITPDGVVRSQTDVVKGAGFRLEYALMGLLVIAMGWVLYRVETRPMDEGVTDASTSAVDVMELERTTKTLANSVAILPLQNLSPDPDNAYFAAGLHEEILSQLAKVRDLSVISRTSVIRYADQTLSIPEIARELNVGTVMEGSVRFAAGKVRIQAQLIDGVADEHLWSEVYQRDLADIFAIQAEIAEHIAAAMEVEILPAEKSSIESHQTESPEALASYIRAISLDWGSADQRDETIALLNDAIIADPDFALALAFRALVRATSLNNDPGAAKDWAIRSAELERLAVSDAEKALEIDPQLGNAHIALARIHQYHWRGTQARQAYEKGIELAPNNVGLLRGFAWFNSVAGDHEYAIELAERAVQLDPNNAKSHAELGQRNTFAGNWDAAYAAHRRAVELRPSNGIYHLRVANNEIARGNILAAIDELRIAEPLILSRSSSPGLLAELAYAYAQAGVNDEAIRIVGRIEELSTERVVGLGAWAMAKLALGEHEEALGLLRSAADETVGRGALDGAFKPLVQIAANVLADPTLDQSEFVEVRSELGFVE